LETEDWRPDLSIGQWDKRFLMSTRGRIVGLLRKRDYTVEELAAELQLTDNAVRAHLAALERDGLVQQAGRQRGVSKPAFLYRLTRNADQLFRKSDAPLLRHLLEALRTRLTDHEFEEVLTGAGQLTAAEAPPTHGSLQERVHQSVELLGELGGLAEVEEAPDAYVIRGFSCPFAAAGPGHPAVCQLAAAFLSEYVHAPVEARCQPIDPELAPRCLFEIQRTHAENGN
jgi:predicted ArsR family transcriptional regulator